MNMEYLGELKKDIADLKKDIDSASKKLLEDKDKLRRWTQALDLLEGRSSKKKPLVKKSEPKLAAA